MDKLISIWLFICAFMVFIIIGIGGYTRLEGAGLSIVEWKPISGVWFPTTEEAWEGEFDRYKQFPEYKARQEQVSLKEFKRIYFIEYFHRLIGRIIGLLFVLPLFLLCITKRINWRDARYLWGVGMLFALQGVVGWYMVSSGLNKVPHVSHYRLAIHMMIAIFIYSLLLWKGITFFMNGKMKSSKFNDKSKHLFILILILLVQITLGAFLAGLDGGMVYNTFPLMNGEFMPQDAWALTPWYLNIATNISTIQFFHRIIPIFIIVYGIIIFKENRTYLISFMLIVFAQCLLGVLALLNFIPTNLALAHQLCAIILLSHLLITLHMSSSKTLHLI